MQEEEAGIIVGRNFVQEAVSGENKYDMRVEKYFHEDMAEEDILCLVGVMVPLRIIYCQNKRTRMTL